MHGENIKLHAYIYQMTHTVVKTPTHYKTHTYTHPHIAKDVKTTTVQVKTNKVHDTHQNEIFTIQSSTLSIRSP